MKNVSLQKLVKQGGLNFSIRNRPKCFFNIKTLLFRKLMYYFFEWIDYLIINCLCLYSFEEKMRMDSFFDYLILRFMKND